MLILLKKRGELGARELAVELGITVGAVRQHLARLVAGGLIAGIAADWLGLSAAIWVVAVITFGSGVIVATRMYETARRGRSGANGPERHADEQEGGLSLGVLRTEGE